MAPVTPSLIIFWHLQSADAGLIQVVPQIRSSICAKKVQRPKDLPSLLASESATAWCNKFWAALQPPPPMPRSLCHWNLPHCLKFKCLMTLKISQHTLQSHGHESKPMIFHLNGWTPNELPSGTQLGPTPKLFTSIRPVGSTSLAKNRPVLHRRHGLSTGSMDKMIDKTICNINKNVDLTNKNWDLANKEWAFLV